MMFSTEKSNYYEYSFRLIEFVNTMDLKLQGASNHNLFFSLSIPKYFYVKKKQEQTIPGDLYIH